MNEVRWLITNVGVWERKTTFIKNTNKLMWCLSASRHVVSRWRIAITLADSWKETCFINELTSLSKDCRLGCTRWYTNCRFMQRTPRSKNMGEIIVNLLRIVRLQEHSKVNPGDVGTWKSRSCFHFEDRSQWKDNIPKLNSAVDTKLSRKTKAFLWEQVGNAQKLNIKGVLPV